MNKRVLKGDLLRAAVYIIACTIIYFGVSGHNLRIINLAMLYSIAVFGLSVMLGMCGMLNFSGITFFGIGAYTVGNLCTGRLGIQMGSISGLLCAILVSGLLGLVIGMVILRCRGTFFTFATIALVQIAYTIFINYQPLFGGPTGIYPIPTFQVGNFSLDNPKEWFVFVACVVGIMILVMERIRRTKIGRSMGSVRDDEIVANSFGINVYRTKLTAFVIQSMLGGLAGSLYAMQNNFVSSDMFTWSKATLLVVMAMLGGINNSFGALVGALLVTALPELFRDFADYFRLLYGLAVILLMIFLPTGLAGLVPMLRSKAKIVGKKYKKAAGGGQ